MIGIFDSGLGGLTVAREVMKELPDVPVIYFGDTARMPYGGKSKETIIKYALEDAEFLVLKGAKILVVACNTVSAVAIGALREKYKISVFEVITPAAKKAVAITKSGRIGIIGTRATISSGIYREKIKEFYPSVPSFTRDTFPYEGKDDIAFHYPAPLDKGSSSDFQSEVRGKEIKIFQQSCPLLVPLVEENWINRPETKSIVRKYLLPLKSAQIDTLILGCTHYPFLKKIIQPKIGRKVKIVDSAETIAKEVKEYCDSNPSVCCSSEAAAPYLRASERGGNPGNRFFVSDITPYFENLAGKWLGINVKIEKADLKC